MIFGNAAASVAGEVQGRQPAMGQHALRASVAVMLRRLVRPHFALGVTWTMGRLRVRTRFTSGFLIFWKIDLMPSTGIGPEISSATTPCLN